VCREAIPQISGENWEGPGDWGFRPPNLLFLPVRGPGSVSITMLPGTTRVSLPNGISFRQTALAGCTSVTDDRHTYRRTDHATVTSVAVGGIAFSAAA